jgi:hypothetical protein
MVVKVYKGTSTCRATIGTIGIRAGPQAELLAFITGVELWLSAFGRAAPTTR